MEVSSGDPIDLGGMFADALLDAVPVAIKSRASQAVKIAKKRSSADAMPPSHSVASGSLKDDYLMEADDKSASANTKSKKRRVEKENHIK